MISTLVSLFRAPQRQPCHLKKIPEDMVVSIIANGMLNSADSVKFASTCKSNWSAVYQSKFDFTTLHIKGRIINRLLREPTLRSDSYGGECFSVSFIRKGTEVSITPVSRLLADADTSKVLSFSIEIPRIIIEASFSKKGDQLLLYGFKILKIVEESDEHEQLVQSAIDAAQKLLGFKSMKQLK